MPPRPKKPSATTASNTFADALRFIALICKDQGSITETHCHIQNGWITAFNGVLAIGHKVDNDLHICPQIKLAIEALSKCGQSIAITQLDNNRLSIKSDKFKAIIPCLAIDLLTSSIPDPPIAVIDDRLKDAFGAMLQSDNGQTIYNASILLNGSSLISTLDGKMIIEYYHGIDLPNGLAIPKAFINPLTKINKKMTKFGFSPSSITIYFEDDSWIKSQLYAENWPSIAHIFDCKPNLWPFPADFFKGLAAVAPFSEGLVYFESGKLRSHAQDGAGAEYEIPGLPGGPCFPAKQLAALEDWASHIDWMVQGPMGAMALAQGKACRAVIAGVKK